MQPSGVRPAAAPVPVCHDRRKLPSLFLDSITTLRTLHSPRTPMRRRRNRDLAFNVVEEVRALLGGEVALSRNCVEEAVSISYGETLANRIALAQGGAEMWRVGFGVVFVGWKAGALVVAGVVVAGSSTRFSCGGDGGEEEGCEGEGVHGRFGRESGWEWCCVDFEKATGGVDGVLYTTVREAQVTRLQ